MSFELRKELVDKINSFKPFVPGRVLQELQELMESCFDESSHDLLTMDGESCMDCTDTALSLVLDDLRRLSLDKYVFFAKGYCCNAI